MIGMMKLILHFFTVSLNGFHQPGHHSLKGWVIGLSLQVMIEDRVEHHGSPFKKISAVGKSWILDSAFVQRVVKQQGDIAGTESEPFKLLPDDLVIACVLKAYLDPTFALLHSINFKEY